MNYWQRKSRQWQALVNLTASLSILLAAACAAFVITQSPLLAVMAAVGATLFGFVAMNEFETVKLLRRKGERHAEAARRRDCGF
jgi:hypothetical protein